LKNRLFCLLLLCLLINVFTGCSSPSKTNTEDTQDQKLTVVTTIFPPYDFTRAIAGDLVELKMLLPPGSESHSFEPTPQDIIQIQNSDLFIYVGGESDDWIDGILESLDTSQIKIITLMDCVEVVEEEVVEGMQEEEGQEEGMAYDEHVWTNPRNAILIVEKISQALCELDQEHCSLYQTNTDFYTQELKKLDAAFMDVVANANRHTIIFADRFPFRYLADAYGLEYYAAFPGCSTETEASAKTVAFLIDKMKQEQIPVIFHIELSNQKMAETIAEETGAAIRELHAVHNISKTDFDAGLTYLDLMYRNVEALKEALE